MHFDFSSILFFASLFTGLVWAVDALWAAPRRQARAAATSDPALAAAASKEPTLVEYCKSFFPVILIVFFLRSFLVEPFRIPSGSMMPTLLAGDFILVNKFAYGIRLPVINRKVVDIHEPQRGDVVVFRYPRDPSVDYIKRVVGLPGDHVAYRDKVLYINNKPQGQVEQGTYTTGGAGLSMAGAMRLTESLDEVQHDILVRHDAPNRGSGQAVVPEGHYFVMGDNRDNSNDSRFWGPVPEENLVGKAFMIWMNWDATNNNVTWSRIGDSIN